MNDTLPYDFSRPHVREAGWNQGCPLGYFAQFVAAGSVDAVDTGTGSGTAVRCRLLPDPVTATPDEVQAILDESGVSWGETFDTYQQAIVDSLPSIMGNLRWGGIVLAAIAGFIAWKSLR